MEIGRFGESRSHLLLWSSPAFPKPSNLHGRILLKLVRLVRQVRVITCGILAGAWGGGFGVSRARGRLWWGWRSLVLETETGTETSPEHCVGWAVRRVACYARELQPLWSQRGTAPDISRNKVIRPQKIATARPA